MDGVVGFVLRIEKCSIYDGDGLRTVVFLKGCPLRCAWCSTPESQGISDPRLCGAPPIHDPAVPVSSPFAPLNPRPSFSMTAMEVVTEIAKDEIFYFHSGGGVTISGGEPLAQPEFCAAILRECKKLGINTAIETSAFGEYQAIESLLPYLDLIYADIKLIDDEEHIKWTGASNETILNNIRRISQNYTGKLRIRLPLIPTVNSDENSIKAAAEFCLSLDRVDGVELLPYHRLGIESYRKLGREYQLADITPPDKKTMAEAQKLLNKTQGDGSVV